MIQATHTFPKNFQWGAASAAHQAEGGLPNSDWAAFEKLPNVIMENGSAAIACDWWQGKRWQQDFDLAAQDGQTAHRLSLDWSRIEPRLAVWDEDALDHYREMIKGARARGLEPMVTLHHFSNPVWLAERGGWENPETIKFFERFTRKVVNALKDLVTTWCTINEINIYAYNSFSDGVWPPQKKNINACFTVIRHMLLGHAAAYRAIHELQPNAQVGIAHHMQFVDPANSASSLDSWVANFQHHTFNEIIPQALHTGRLDFPVGRWQEHLPELANTMDYVGVNYYTRRLSAFDLSKPTALFGRTFHTPTAELDNIALNELYPEGLFRVLEWADRFKKPIYITENGWGDVDESRRARAMVLHLRNLWSAVNYNFPVKGYFYWTLVDNFEWERGWVQRFGLYELDVPTQKRTPRAVAKLYAEVCRTNTLTSDMVARYAPDLLPTLFPG